MNHPSPARDAGGIFIFCANQGLSIPGVCRLSEGVQPEAVKHNSSSAAAQGWFGLTPSSAFRGDNLPQKCTSSTRGLCHWPRPTTGRPVHTRLIRKAVHRPILRLVERVGSGGRSVGQTPRETGRRSLPQTRALSPNPPRPMNVARPKRNRDASNFDDYLMLALTLALFTAMMVL